MSEAKLAVTLGAGTDDRLLWDLEAGFWQFLSMLVAHDLKLFALLAQAPQTLAEICAALAIKSHPATALLNACIASGLVQRTCVDMDMDMDMDERELYALTAIATDFLVSGSPTYRGAVLNAAIKQSATMNFATLKKAVLTGTPQIYGGDAVFTVHAAETERAEFFTDEMHSISRAPAEAWPKAVDLTPHRLMLDIGGGSGVHSLYAVQKWPGLQALVFDLATVCKITQTHIARRGLMQRVSTTAGNMWDDPYPAADLHFYSWIFHDYSAERCRVLADKSFASLPSGGRIIVHEMLYNDDKTGPAAVATLDVSMLVWAQGQEYSGRELTALLTAAGFTQVVVQPTWGYWSVVTGVKP